MAVSPGKRTGREGKRRDWDRERGDTRISEIFILMVDIAGILVTAGDPLRGRNNRSDFTSLCLCVSASLPPPPHSTIQISERKLNAAISSRFVSSCLLSKTNDPHNQRERETLKTLITLRLANVPIVINDLRNDTLYSFVTYFKIRLHRLSTFNICTWLKFDVISEGFERDIREQKMNETLSG